MSPRPLVVDTDPGIDDAFALVLAAHSPEVDLRALTTVFGNVGLESTTLNARRLLALVGREDVPVAAGAARPLVYPQPPRAALIHGDDGLGGQGASLPTPGAEVDPRPAVEVLADVLRRADEPVTIAPIGPMTNIALLLASYPELKPKIERLVVMGGGLEIGNITATAEFNIWSDPEAARRVLVEEDVPVVLVPIDLTHRCAVDSEWLDTLANSGPVGESLVGLTAPYRANYRKALSRDAMALHDAVALAEVIQPGILRCERMAVEVECGVGPTRGMVIGDRRNHSTNRVGREIEVAVDADLDALRAFLLDRMGSSRR
ncbi:pyrimidine-specific ribonucleoside hydrolase [Streptoalloteichus tenebrarius]|uniref:Pyrimidine-specific ribonucleoside hydrolase n=1 Tax=Streptoalloteichus tenebrarius (strain ATCC 17920 / DSM 40477 / JCM 4838 / CBS 697.72 / NBRC 16177 / NCIMB 11028 / NRRL B-12390 / A12253. 1 / ISP 5477) TaxID=1933 RepID=A0ABT1HWK3_STRSD|nr:nucleoside hydrolase [Streptoalloteichus tenebrarius]MCP2259905.1 pyrimidine-specific ribonucleoside hydrolase [Streptoalloteichus tenebrarius]BFF03230.1 nucleoside hydrolase [Streptoalloteichus tenebrarius]